MGTGLGESTYPRHPRAAPVLHCSTGTPVTLESEKHASWNTGPQASPHRSEQLSPDPNTVVSQTNFYFSP